MKYLPGKGVFDSPTKIIRPDVCGTISRSGKSGIVMLSSFCTSD